MYMKVKIFILFFLLLLKISVFGYDSTAVSLALENSDTAHFYSINQYWTFAVNVIIKCTNPADSFAAAGIYVNFDTNYLRVVNLKYNENAVLDLENGVNGAITDSNGNIVKFQLNEFFYNYNSDSISASFLVVKPNLSPQYTNVHIKLFTIYFEARNSIDTTYLVFNFTEPRKTTLSRDGFDQTKIYDTLAIKINTAPVAPEITFPSTDFDTKNNSIIIAGTRSNSNDTIALYVNDVFYKYDTAVNSNFSFLYNFHFPDTYNFYAVEINNLGNASMPGNRVKIKFDTAPPLILNYFPQNNSYFADTDIENITINYKDVISGIDTVSIIIDTGISYNFTNKFTITDTSAFLNTNLPPGSCTVQFYIRDKAFNDTMLIFKFRILNYQVPSIVNLLSPINNYETELYTTMNFKWDTEIHSETFHIQIDTEPNFINPIINYDTITALNITITNLEYKSYYWRICGRNFLYNGPWSSIRKFTLGKDLTTPVISSVIYKDRTNNANIDNSDDGIKIQAYFYDNISLKSISFSYGLNDTQILTDNYSLDQPNTGTISHTFQFFTALNTGDRIYIKIRAIDNNYNDTVYYDTIIVGSIIVDTPSFIISHTAVNYNPINLYGLKQVNSTVKINNIYIATSTSDTEWQYSYTLTPGTNIISINAYIGNVYSGTSTIVIIYDIYPPTVYDNVPSTVQSNTFVVQFTGYDTETGLKKIYYSTNNGLTYNQGNTVAISVDGTYYIKYFAVDNAGNTSSIYSAAHPARLDTMNPQPVACYDQGDVSFDTKIEFSWNLSVDSSAIVNYYIEIDISPLFDTPIIYGGWTNSTLLSFSFIGINGETYYAHIKSKDEAGNISVFGNSSDGIKIDTSVAAGTAPPSPKLNPFPLKTNESVITLSGTYPVEATLVLVNGSQADMNADSIWTKTIVLTNGINFISVYCKNKFGLSSSSETGIILMDNIPPAPPDFTVVSPTNSSTQLIRGTKSNDSDTILVNGNNAIILSDTVWQYTINFIVQGYNIINVIAIDSFNNRSDTITKQIYFDNIAPSAPYLTNYISPYSGTQQTVEGWFDTSADIVKVNNMSGLINKETARWIFTVNLDIEGNNNFNVKSFDAAGNFSETDFVIVRDLTPPDKPKIKSPENNITVTISPVIVSGTVPAEAYGIYINDKLNTDISSGTFSVSVALVRGANVITAKCIDKLNNASAIDAVIINYEPAAFLVSSEQIEGKSTLTVIPDSLSINANSEIDTTTINETNVTITKNSIIISGHFQFYNNNHSFYFIPDTPFELEQIYVLQVKTGVKNIEGRNLYQNISWTFKTGVDTTMPVITNLNIRNDKGSIVIYNSDIGFIISATVSDTGTGLKMVRFDVGINDTTYSTNNYTYTYPSNGVISRYFSASLNTNDKIYYRIYAEDKSNNSIISADSVIVGAAIIPMPALDAAIDTTVNYTPVILSGWKYYESTVYINGIKATATDTDKWSYSLNLVTGINNPTITAKVGSSTSSDLKPIIIYDVTPPTASNDAPANAKNIPYTVKIIGQDVESGIKRILISLNDNEFIETDSVIINKEYANKIMYKVENNCEIFSETYTVFAYYDITKPQPVKVIDEGSISTDTVLIWYWDMPVDSSPISYFEIQISNDKNFSNIIYDTMILNGQTFFRITGDMNNNIIIGDTYYSRVFATDIAGNTSDTGNSSFWSNGIFIDTGFVDNIPPEKPVILSPATASNTNAAVITVSGTAAIDAVLVLINGLPITLSDTSWSKVISLAQGINEIRVSSKDEAGNESLSDSIIMIMDNIPPAIPTVDDTTPTITNKSNIILSGTVEEGAIVKIDGTGDGVIVQGKKYRKSIIQPEGIKTYTITAEDTFGNVSDTKYFTIKVDLTPPSVPTCVFITPTNRTTQVLNGTMESGTTLYINDTTSQVLVSGSNWSYEVTLNEDTNIYRIKSLDGAGNTSETTIIIFLDITAPPNPIIIYPYNGLETAESPIRIEGTKPVGSYVYVNGQIAAGNYNDTSWVIAALSLTSGVNVINATTRDELGNESPGSTIIVNFNVNLFLVKNDMLDNSRYILKPDSIVLQLNKGANEATLNKTNINLIEENQNVDFNYEYNSLSKQIKIIYDFKANMNYSLNIKKSLTSLEGVQLTQDRNWNFRILINKNETAVIALNNGTVKMIIKPYSVNNNNFIVNSNIIPLSDGRIINANDKINEISSFWQTLGVSANYYEIAAYLENGVSIDSYLISAELYIYYSDANNDGIIDNTILNEKNNYLFKLNDNSGRWERLTSEVNIADNYVKVDFNNFGIFTILSSEKVKIDSNVNCSIPFDNNNFMIELSKNALPDNSYIDCIKMPPSSDIVKLANAKIDDSNSYFKTLGLNSIIYQIKSYTIDGSENTNFDSDVLVAIRYPDINNDGYIDNTNLYEENNFIHQLNSDSNCWIRLENIVDTTNNIVTSNIAKTGIYTILSSSKQRIKENVEKLFVLNNNKIEILVPQNTLDSNIYFDFNEVSLNTPKVRLANSSLESSQGFFRTLGLNPIMYDINCYTIDGRQISQFVHNLKISFRYDDNNNDGIVDGTNINEKLLRPFFLNDTGSVWQIIENYELDSINKKVIFYLNHLTILSILASNIAMQEVWIYPNPTENKKINLFCRPSKSGIVKISITTPLGHNVYKGEFYFDSINPTPVEIDLKDLPVGAYFVIIKINNEQKILGLGIGK